MATTSVIPPLTIPQGITVLGPFAPGVGLSRMDLALDIGNLTQPCDMLLEYAADGVTWQGVAEQNVAGPPTVDRQGNPVPPTMHWSANLGNLVDGPVLTVTGSKIRLTVNNTVAFASSGGSLVVS